MITLDLDIEMPEFCADCPFNYDFLHCVADKEMRRIDYYGKAEFCPLKEKQTNNINSVYRGEKTGIINPIATGNEKLGEIQPTTAKWISCEDDDLKISEYRCSNCGKYQDDVTNFCPNCGKKMESGSR